MSWIQCDLQSSGSNEYVPCSWTTGTDSQIVEAVNKHYAGEVDLTEYWAVGDERTVTLTNQETVVLVLSQVGGKLLSDGLTECIFQVDQKDCLSSKRIMNIDSTNEGGWEETSCRTFCNITYKNYIPTTIRGIFKSFINQQSTGLYSNIPVVKDVTDNFALRARVEVYGNCETAGNTNISGNTNPGEGVQVDLYRDSTTRIKNCNGSAENWWLRSASNRNNVNFCYNRFNGGVDGTDPSFDEGIAPFGVI